MMRDLANASFHHAKRKKIAVIGECMIELRPNITEVGYTESTIDAQIAYGGDTLNVATYLARQGVGVEYVTMLGDDPLSDWMVKQWQANGVRCDLVRREKRGLPGMYWINIDDSGERSFYYLIRWGVISLYFGRRFKALVPNWFHPARSRRQQYPGIDFVHP